MRDLCRQLRRNLRYWIFPESRLIDQRTEEIDHQQARFKKNLAETGRIVRNANQPDALRNLVIAMTSDRKGRLHDT